MAAGREGIEPWTPRHYELGYRIVGTLLVNNGVVILLVYDERNWYFVGATWNPSNLISYSSRSTMTWKPPRAAELLESNAEETLSCFDFPSDHWREICRRTRVLGAFPDGKSVSMLVAARLRHIASTRWGKRCYLAMETPANAVHQEVAA